MPGMLAVMIVLAGCGGGGGSTGIGASPPVSQNPTIPTIPTIPVTPSEPTPEDLNPNLLGASGLYRNFCAVPRSGYDIEGTAFPDRQGSLLHELKFLRAWANQYYLWYDEIPNTYKMADYSDPYDYFAVLKTQGLTPSGQAKDRYHFTYATADWDAMQIAGIELGYGVTWSRNSATAPRTWLVAQVEPGSPAADAGFMRGDMLVKVDGVDFVNATDGSAVDAINAGLFPETTNSVHRFELRRNGVSFQVSMTGAQVRFAPVKNVKVLETSDGKVGYLTFDTFNALSERRLYDAFTTLRSAGVKDLVLDLRYNGGGLLNVASQLAYMISGPTYTSGKVFDRPQYNNKIGEQLAIMFRSTATGFNSSEPLRPGTSLPTLGLKRVTVLTTSSSCSASEAVINGLRGADVEVIQIGGTTCGKPYGFTPSPNCGTTYFSIEFKGVNHKGFGDYADGFEPTCRASDDLSHALGDPAEGLLAAALRYREQGVCPVSTARAREVPMEIVRPAVKEIAIYTPPDRESR